MLRLTHSQMEASYTLKHQALSRAMEMVEEGAQIIDIGGESTRPGARAIDVAEEIERTGADH